MDIGGLFTYRKPATRRGNSYLDQGKIQDYNATFFVSLLVYLIDPKIDQHG